MRGARPCRRAGQARFLLLASCLSVWAGMATAQCRLALVLALDVSGSVDAREYRLQMGGIADALMTEEVTQAILGVPGFHVALSVFEWSGAGYQRQVLDWRALHDVGDIAAVAAHLRTWPRAVAPEDTAIGAAMLHGARVLARGPSCWRQVIDLSADGRSNDGLTPRAARRSTLLDGVTINGLIVGDEGPHPRLRTPQELRMTDYFRSEILKGAEAFSEVAEGYEDYARAMARKLLREVETPPVGSLDAGVRLAGR